MYYGPAPPSAALQFPFSYLQNKDPLVTSFAKLSPSCSVAGQLTVDDVTMAAGQGYKSIINNRPDGEGENQPAGTDIAAAAAEQGLEYRHVPAISGKLTDADVTAMKAALAEMQAPVLAFCRTGTRSATLWALAQAGTMSADEVLKAATGAGYELEALRPRLEAATPTKATPTKAAAKPKAKKPATKKPTTNKTSAAKKSGQKPGASFDVVIVGGGAAGIGVAANLLRRAPAMRVAIIEPSARHYYQPAWTLVGGGVFDYARTERAEARLIPQGAEWIKAAAAEFEPDGNSVTLEDDRKVSYRTLVVCPGIKLDWDAVEGLRNTLGQNGVTSNYQPGLSPYTWSLVKTMREGRAIFTQPPLPFKCTGAPQKAMYLACSYWELQATLGGINVEFNTAGEVLFGVPDFVPPLMEYVKRYNAKLCFSSNLTKVDGPAKKAWFEISDKDGNKTIEEKTFDMLHVCPPQTSPDFIRVSPLADQAGWVEVNPDTLQHVRWPNVFGLGDACSAPNAKTAAAVRKQVPVVARNLSAVLAGNELPALYEGYGSCPLTVERGRVVLAEFGYGGKLQPTFPLDPVKPRWIWWVLKTKILPFVYWGMMLKGVDWLAEPKSRPGTRTQTPDG